MKNAPLTGSDGAFLSAMSYLFLSDLHLSVQFPALTERFLDFCAGPAQQARRVYILGDLFDFWVGDDQMNEPFARTVVAALAGIASVERRLFIQHGNRDFLLGERFAKSARATLISDPYVVDMFGAQTILTHGDILCTDDVRYQLLRRKWRAPQRFDQIMLLPYWARRRIGLRWRAESQRKMLSAPAGDAADVNQEAVIAMMRRLDAAQMIHGHVHRPAMHAVSFDGRDARRIVLGDWREDRAPYLEISESGVQCRDMIGADEPAGR